VSVPCRNDQAPRLSGHQRQLADAGQRLVAASAREIAAGVDGTDLDDQAAVYRSAFAATQAQLANALAIIDQLTGEAR
jgi:hypothetical protein